MTCGTYKLSIGARFVIASSLDFRNSRRRILSALGRGVFPHRGLQASYERLGAGRVVFTPLSFMKRGVDEGEEAFLERVREEEQKALRGKFPIRRPDNQNRLARGPGF